MKKYLTPIKAVILLAQVPRTSLMGVACIALGAVADARAINLNTSPMWCQVASTVSPAQMTQVFQNGCSNMVTKDSAQTYPDSVALNALTSGDRYETSEADEVGFGPIIPVPYMGPVLHTFTRVFGIKAGDGDETGPAYGALMTGYYLPVCPNTSPSTGLRFIPKKTQIEANACGPMLINKSGEAIPDPCQGVGDPIYPLTGTTRQELDVHISIGGIPLTFTYDTKFRNEANSGWSALGPMWVNSLFRNIDSHQDADTGYQYYEVTRGNGSKITFWNNGAGIVHDPGTNHQLTITADGFIFVDGDSQDVEKYNQSGQLLTLSTLNGVVLTFTYSLTGDALSPAAGYLLNVTDQNGRVINFTYSLPTANSHPQSDGVISNITDDSGLSVIFDYDQFSNLWGVAFKDQNSRTFLYERPDLPWAMTGVVDGIAHIHEIFSYSASGLAISTELAGGVNKYSVSYDAEPTTATYSVLDATSGKNITYAAAVLPVNPVITDSSGRVNAWTSTLVSGRPRVAGRSQPSGSGCSASSNSSVFDVNTGNLLSKDNFNGVRSCFAYDSNNRQTAAVEGLANTVACSDVIPSGATVPVGARKTTTSWHPIWRLPVTVTAPGTIRSYIYNGQPDPFNAGVVSSCSSIQALPNNLAVPLLCKSVVQATLLSGAVDTTVVNIVHSYTYDSSGQLLSDVDQSGRTTTTSRYSDTVFPGSGPSGHTVGDIQSLITPDGLVTTFNSYDRLGNPLVTTLPNGTVITYTYDGNGRNLTKTITYTDGKSRTFTLVYDKNGSLVKATGSDGTFSTYAYDDAHRLISSTDPSGNVTTYTLDSVGNRIVESFTDPLGVIQRTVTRSFDALNRLQQVTGAKQ